MARLLNKSKSLLGFTLIELLVVIAIVALLATIGLPIFQKYRARAYDSAALSDITQFRSAVVNAESFVAGGGTWTSGFHPLFTEVAITKLVQIVWTSSDVNGAQVFTANGCNSNGNDGYRVIIPYGAAYTPVDTESPNEIVSGAIHRAAAGC
jgi:prepilin-type N-terminal cleavage/methylation domain-containing protein